MANGLSTNPKLFPPKLHTPGRKARGFLFGGNDYIRLMDQRPEDEFDDGAGERLSLDTPSKFTLTRFRRSKFTKYFLWLISFMGLGWGT